MKKTKVLFLMQEITPYVDETYLSNVGRYLPQKIQENGFEIRTFTPKYGCINERRNQLHEVIRLSGMNLIINEMDHPLIIKVASISSARMQIYFIDNEDFFQRKAILCDAKGKFFNDNDERMIFFTRGAIETVKKLSWAPDIIHCHGWITAFSPAYLKEVVKDNPLFANTKIVYSIYDGFDKDLDKNFKKKVLAEGIDSKTAKTIEKPSFENLTKLAIDNSDAVILGKEGVDKEIINYLKSKDKLFIHHNEETYVEEYSALYEEVLNEVLNEVCVD